MTISVEPARTRAQLESFLAVGSVVHPGPKPDVATLEHELAIEPRTRFLLASLDGVTVATGVGKPSSIGDALYAMVRVLPGYRLRGVGTTVLASLSRHARTAECGSLIGRLREDDEDARRFVAHRGFTVLSRECPVALDLTRYERPPSGPPAGVALVSLAERPDLVEAAYEVEAETIRDIPVGPEAPTPRSYAAWRAETIECPRRAARPVARCARAGRGDRLVGARCPRRRGGGGREPPHRGAACCPRPGGRDGTQARAGSPGKARRARRIETVNDEENIPMRAVNARLGFQAEPAWLLVRGPLVG